MRALALAACAVALGGCSLIQGVTGGRGVDAAALKNEVTQGSKLAADYDAQKTKCRALADKEVSVPEEQAIGGAIALALGAKSEGGVFVEVSPEVKDAGSIDPARWKDRKPAPGTGPKTDLTRYVATLGKGLAGFSDRPGLDWTFIVLDSPVANAFSAPGGYVFVTTAMVRKTENEAQLAAVLAHEISHVTGKHALIAYQQAKYDGCMAAFWGDQGAKAGQVVMGDLEQLPFAGELKRLFGLSSFDPNQLTGKAIQWFMDKVVNSLTSKGLDRDQEHDADVTATRILMFAGYDVGQFEKLVASLPDGGGSLTAHPSNKARLAAIGDAKREYSDLVAPGKEPPLPKAAAVVR